MKGTGRLADSDAGINTRLDELAVPAHLPDGCRLAHQRRHRTWGTGRGGGDAGQQWCIRAMARAVLA